MPVPEPLPEWGPGGLLPARPAQTRPRPVVAFLRSLPLPPPHLPRPPSSPTAAHGGPGSLALQSKHMETLFIKEPRPTTLGEPFMAPKKKT